MDKIWKVIAAEKEGKYKVRNSYYDHEGGVCITYLIARGLGYPDVGLVQPWLHNKTKGILSLSSKYPRTAFGHYSAFQIQHKPKQELLNEFGFAISDHFGRAALRDMILLNDNSEVGFDDFEEIFKEFDI